MQKLISLIRGYIASARLSEEALYAQALAEIEAGIRRDGLWAKALSSADMDTTRAHKIYIELRVKSLKDELTLSKGGSKLGSLTHTHPKQPTAPALIEEIKPLQRFVPSGRNAYIISLALSFTYLILSGTDIIGASLYAMLISTVPGLIFAVISDLTIIKAKKSTKSEQK